MENRSNNQGRMWRGMLIFIIGIAVLFSLNIIKYGSPVKLNYNVFQNFLILFVSIVLEAMPFVMLGALVSALIQIYVSEETIVKYLPKNKFIGLLAASLMGIIFPVCECAIVPISRRLIKKGVPLDMAVAFMLSVPIVNPIVLLSTYYAFNDVPLMAVIRGGFGLLGAITIGMLVGEIQNGTSPLKDELTDGVIGFCACGLDHGSKTKTPKITELLEHTSHELYDIGRYLIIGAFLSAVFQTVVSRNLITVFGQHQILSVLGMMALAYVLSLCSEADAFIARTFLGQFTTGSIAAFLISGPMIDIKNTLMLSGVFKKAFVIRLIVVIFSVCFFIGFVVNRISRLGILY